MKVKEITKTAMGLLATASFISTPALALADGGKSMSSGGGIVVIPLLLMLLASACVHNSNRR